MSEKKLKKDLEIYAIRRLQESPLQLQKKKQEPEPKVAKQEAGCPS